MSFFLRRKINAMRKQRKKATSLLRTMALELYEMLNLSYLDFVEKLAEAFGTCEKKPIPALVVEFQVVSKLLSQNLQTDRIYKRIHEGFKTIIDAVYEKKASIFKRTSTRIALFEYTHLYEVFPRMQKHEHNFLWECLQSLAQPLCTLSGSSKYIDSMTEIAQEFLRKNPHADEKNSRELLFAQMLTDSSLMDKTAGIFENSDISSMRSDFAEVIRGFGFAADVKHGKKSRTAKDVNNEPQIVEVKDGEEDEESVDDSKEVDDEADTSVDEAAQEKSISMHVPSAVAESDLSMEALFADMAIKDAAITKKTAKRRKTKSKNPLKNMLDFMEQKPLDATQLQEMKDIAKKTLSSNAKSEDREKMQKMFAMFGNKDATADTLVEQFRTACGNDDDPEAQQVMEMIAQMKSNTASKSLFENFSAKKL